LSALSAQPLGTYSPARKVVEVKAKEAAGKATGSSKTEVKGKAQQAKGELQNGKGDAKEGAKKNKKKK